MDSVEVKVKEEIDKYVDGNKQILIQGVYSGVVKTINTLKERLKQVVSNQYFNSRTSRHYTKPLIEGVKGYMATRYGKQALGWVNILGNTIVNDGTWRLRMFQGTKKRYTKTKVNVTSAEQHQQLGLSGKFKRSGMRNVNVKYLGRLMDDKFFQQVVLTADQVADRLIRAELELAKKKLK